MKRWMSAVVLFLLFACSDARRVVVGSKNFTEQVILGEMLAQLLEVRDVPVDRRLNLGSSFICHNALVNGSLDLYVEYTGTALASILGESVLHDPGDVLERVRTAYWERFHLSWGLPLGFNNTYAMAMRPKQARALGIRRISELKAHESVIRLGSGHEFLEREDGFWGLTKAYGLEFVVPPRGMELGLIYQALTGEQVDLVAGNSTDGLIDKFGLVVLEDDLKFFPPYDAVPVYRTDAAEAYPKLQTVLDLIGGQIEESTMRRLNREVDIEGRKLQEVVREFISTRGWN